MKKTLYPGYLQTARALKIATLCKGKTAVVLTSDKETASRLISDLRFFLTPDLIREYPFWDPLPFETVSPQVYLTSGRLQILSSLLKGLPQLIVTTPTALFQKVPTPEFFTSKSLELLAGAHLTIQDLEEHLLKAGFTRVRIVEEIGQYALRGSIIDFYPASQSMPVRASFMGDTLRALQLFRTESQRTAQEISTTFIDPVRELWFDNIDKSLLFDRIKERGKKLETPAREIAATVHALREEKHYAGIELHQYIASTAFTDFFRYLPEDSVFILDEPHSIQKHSDDFYQLIQDRYSSLLQEHFLLPSPEEVYLSPEVFENRYQSHAQHIFDTVEYYDDEADSHYHIVREKSIPTGDLVLSLRARAGTESSHAPLQKKIEAWRKDKYQIAFVTGSESRAARLKRNLLELDYELKSASSMNGLEWIHEKNAYPLLILNGHLSESAILPDVKKILLTEQDLYGEKSVRKKDNSTSEINIKKLLSSLSQLDIGDYIVHIDYGIGIYRGFRQVEVDGQKSDLIQIEYADSMLYLPLTNIGRVQRFSALEGQTPRIDKLSSTRWKKTRQKVQQSVATLAGDLIKLYAARNMTQGFAFDSPNFEDERFADDFPYNETQDQLRAIEETLHDMSTKKPMDRLVCGDVGFGKTEVAMRAAYKAVQSSRQVAVLAPTTILVEQHKQSFLKRFQDFPVTVDALSRFYPPEKNKKVLEQLQTGELDIVIGTHKLLQRDVLFKDLGLLIIDEEHRFGVKQKERIKQIKKNVDVLALTATPIPRTLHMSLLELRDISIISTAPSDRRTIRTYVAPEQETLIRDAIRREVQRGGQCFFIHNRVQNIELITSELKDIVPEVSIDYAHGQMSERELERKMHSFLKKEIDVLVSTTIVESGIDIPTANTIIINRADMFGLAQLYQLRGRVGRSDRQAYCYFLVPHSKKMSGEAKERLRALQSLDDLGQGFHLALRDLEIRGAGNLLGKEQSGNVLSVGFDLYTKILKEAIHHLSESDLSVDEFIEPEVKVSVNAYIPEDYIPDVPERLVLYQRLSAITGYESGILLAEEIEDRFGTIGEELDELIQLMCFRAELKKHLVEKTDISEKKIILAFSPKANLNMEKVIALLQSNPKYYSLSKNNSLTVGDPELYGETQSQTYRKVLTFLDSISG